MPSTIVRAAAWLLLAAIIFTTLAPVRFRPELGSTPDMDRFVAFAAAGALLTLAYPRHFWRICLVVCGAAVFLEAAQLLVPSRHGETSDLAVKIAGGAVGFALGGMVNAVAGRRKP